MVLPEEGQVTVVKAAWHAGVVVVVVGATVVVVVAGAVVVVVVVGQDVPGMQPKPPAASGQQTSPATQVDANAHSVAMQTPSAQVAGSSGHWSLVQQTPGWLTSMQTGNGALTQQVSLVSQPRHCPW
jgi:hypothetical protein